MRSLVPWWFRIALKICLSRMPISYKFWKRVSLFEHGDMDQPARAWDIFLMHARSAGVLDEFSELPRLIGPEGSLNVLELGPGDSLFAGLIAQALGASRTWLVDTGRYATKDVARYEAMSAYLRGAGLHAADVSSCTDIDSVLTCGSMTYLTGGVSSLKDIPDASIDYCFSNAVLEHVERRDFALLVSELHRILKPEGRACHRVDLKDHLGGGLNNLRFSQTMWEGRFFKSSGFYTNRIRFTPMVEIFKAAGFSVQCPRIERWENLPIHRRALAPEFQEFSDAELSVSGFDLVVRHVTAQQQDLGTV